MYPVNISRNHAPILDSSYFSAGKGPERCVLSILSTNTNAVSFELQFSEASQSHFKGLIAELIAGAILKVSKDLQKQLQHPSNNTSCQSCCLKISNPWEVGTDCIQVFAVLKSTQCFRQTISYGKQTILCLPSISIF